MMAKVLFQYMAEKTTPQSRSGSNRGFSTWSLDLKGGTHLSCHAFRQLHFLSSHPFFSVLQVKYKSVTLGGECNVAIQTKRWDHQYKKHTHTSKQTTPLIPHRTCIFKQTRQKGCSSEETGHWIAQSFLFCSENADLQAGRNCLCSEFHCIPSQWHGPPNLQTDNQPPAWSVLVSIQVPLSLHTQLF